MAATPLIQVMLNPAWYPHPVDQCTLIETHISWVILTGAYAYKIKKPLDLGFLDFSTLEKRRHCCEEELRLNGRLAPDIYLELLSIGGTAEQPRYAVEPAIEYAVRMRQFDPAMQLDRLLANDKLTPAMIAAFAEKIGRFHQQIARSSADSEFGSPHQVWQPMAQNFQQIRAHLPELEDHQQLAALEHWSENQFHRLQPLLAQRQQQGFVRECHGDMHLANMAWLQGEALIFDGIEFNPALRWIDVISEVAFMVMDLHQHQHHDLAWYFLNTWLEQTGDYAALPLLNFYLVYRAMVRAKIAAIRLAQLTPQHTDYQASHDEFNRYLTLANFFIHSQPPRLLLCHGVSGSGKSHWGMRLLEQLGGIRLRSDVERKRLFGLSSQQRGGEGIYTPEASRQVYQHLLTLAEPLLQNGYTVLVDATFLDPGQREPFRQLAARLACDYFILGFQASEATLRERLAQRKHDASDANGAVLTRQLDSLQPLTGDEFPTLIVIDTEQPEPLQQALASLSTTSIQNDAKKGG